MAEHVETEFRLRARRPLEIATVDATLREVGAGCRRAETRRHSDIYLDDPLGSLHKHGIGLRVRSDRDGQHLTCKGRRTPPANGAGHSGLFVRLEVATQWPSSRPPQNAAELPAELRDAVEPFVLDRQLAPTLRLDVEREVRILGQDGHELCELAIDHVAATAAGRSARFDEVEIEVGADVERNERLARDLQARLPLAFAEQDKPTHAAALLGIERPAPARTEGLALEPLGRAILIQAETRLAEMRTAEVAVRSRDDAEPLHQMRVAVRRLRTLVRAFRELWSPATAARLVDALGDVGRRLGALRDLDVMIAALPGEVACLPTPLRGAGERAAAWITTRRHAAARELREWLRSPSRLSAAAGLDDDLRAIAFDAGPARRPFAAAAPAALARAVARLRRLVDSLPDDLPIAPAHALRLAAKRVRYLAEECAGLPGMDFGKALRRVVGVQQALGVLCDHDVAAGQLLGWTHAAAHASADGAMTAAALGGLATRHAMAAQSARKRAAKALARVDRKSVWRMFPARSGDDDNMA